MLLYVWGFDMGQRGIGMLAVGIGLGRQWRMLAILLDVASADMKAAAGGTLSVDLWSGLCWALGYPLISGSMAGSAFV